jgi:hypothetical protein
MVNRPIDAPTPTLRITLPTKGDITVDPITHLPPLHPPPRVPQPPLFLPLIRNLDIQHRSTLHPPPRKPNHLTLVRTTRVGASRRVIVENIFIGDVRRVREEYLRIRRRLVGEEDEEAWIFFVEDRAER